MNNERILEFKARFNIGEVGDVRFCACVQTIIKEAHAEAAPRNTRSPRPGVCGPGRGGSGCAGQLRK